LPSLVFQRKCCLSSGYSVPQTEHVRLSMPIKHNTPRVQTAGCQRRFFFRFDQAIKSDRSTD
jgi:hypothetical protein